MNAPESKLALRDRLRSLWYQVAGKPIEIDLRRLWLEVTEIRDQKSCGLSDAELATKARSVKERAARREPTDELRIEALAVAAEASSRYLGLRPFDVQLVAAIALSEGKVIGLDTGEGKTLAAALAAVLQALSGDGVHVLTTNDYLAQRDAALTKPIFELFELTVEVVTEASSTHERKVAYAADVTYLTAKEAGFDFLRDSVALFESEIVQGGRLNAAIVDEADFILIDEARIPLVIASHGRDAKLDRVALAQLARDLLPNIDYETDEYERNISLTERGLERAEDAFGIRLQDPEHHQKLCAIHVALQAEKFLKRDRDYIVSADRIELVDELTGRVAADRRWPHGIQQAVEAKEGVSTQPGGRVLAQIPIQHFVRKYRRLAGMTATALPAAEELFEVYGLATVPIPPRTQSLRVDESDVVFATKAGKRKAILDEVVAIRETGQPILVGTPSVRESEGLATALAKRGIPCNVLNARHHSREAELIAQAGATRAVTISTNMAGRGTDIPLGGGDPVAHQYVASRGGLYVIGTSRHESRRIDNQLRGRSGRQGDPGNSRFFVSLEDDLIRRYGVTDLIPRSCRPGPGVERIDDPIVEREIARAQRIIEGQHKERRRTLSRYAEQLGEQWRCLRERRRRILSGSEEHTASVQAAAPEKWSELVDAVGEEATSEAVRRIGLSVLDTAWADHLALVEDVKEGIHLVRQGGLDPLHQFHLQINEAFARLEDDHPHAVERIFRSLQVTNQVINLEAAGVRGTGSTWTYLVSDDPFSTFGGPVMQSVGGAAALGLVAAAAWPITVALAGIALLTRRWRARRKNMVS